MIAPAPLTSFTRRWLALPQLAALAFGASLLALAPAASAQAMKVAIVDTRRAVMETEEGLRAQATLKKLFEKRQRELDQKQKDLQKEREDLEKNNKTIPQEQLAQRAEKWQREMAQMQTVYVEYNRELQQKESELTQPIVQKAVGIIRRIATQEGYDMVLERANAPYFRSDLDLTDKVITLFNREGGGAKAPAAPAPAKAPAAAPPPAAPKK